MGNSHSNSRKNNAYPVLEKLLLLFFEFQLSTDVLRARPEPNGSGMLSMFSTATVALWLRRPPRER